MAAQSDSADTASNRALAEIGLAFTLAALLCSARLAGIPLTAWWFAPLIGLGAASALLGLTLRDFDLDTGRSPEDAYNLVSGVSTEDAYERILAMLQEAIAANAPPIANRFTLLTWGQYALGATIVMGPLVLWLLRGVALPT
ncbi:MAG: hypothetical protein WB116_12275 [Candidatus Dormiibacterota bacterium]